MLVLAKSVAGGGHSQGKAKILKFGAVMAMTNSYVLCSTFVGILCFAIIPG